MRCHLLLGLGTKKRCVVEGQRGLNLDLFYGLFSLFGRDSVKNWFKPSKPSARVYKSVRDAPKGGLRRKY